MNGKFEDIPNNYTEELFYVLNRCLDKNANTRIDSNSLIEQPVIKFHLKSNGINIGKQTRVSYFDKLNEQELTPKGKRVMNFDTSQERIVTKDKEKEFNNSQQKILNSNKKSLIIDIEDESNNKSELRDQSVTPKQVSSKSNVLEQNMTNNAY